MTISTGKEKDITVFDNNGKPLSPCSLIIANRLVKRNSAEWIEPNRSIRLLVNKQLKQKLKKEAIAKDSRICYICGEMIPENKKATVDHVNPKKRYGEDSLDNFRCCCVRCNNDKGDMYIYEYIKIIKKNEGGKYSYVPKKRIAYLEEFAESFRKGGK